MGLPVVRTVAASYWDPKSWIHYVQMDGTWYYDMYMVAGTTAGQYVVFNASNQRLYLFDRTITGFTALIDYTNPALFPIPVHFLAWPNGQALTGANIWVLVIDSIAGDTAEWITLDTLVNAIASGHGSAFGLGNADTNADFALAAGRTRSLAQISAINLGLQLNQVWGQPNCEVYACTTVTYH